LSDSLIAAAALAFLTAINCFGVRAGSRVQSAMTLTAIAAIGVLEFFSFLHGGPSQVSFRPILDQPPSLNLALAFLSAMTPVLFAYGGWQTSSFLGGEVRDPRKTLPRGLVLGVLGVIAVYTSVNFVYVRALGPAGLAATTTPASAVMRAALRHGRRPRFFSRRCLGPSSNPRSGRRDRAARRLGHRDCSHRHLRASRQLRGRHGFGLLRPHRRLSSDAASPRRAVSPLSHRLP